MDTSFIQILNRNMRDQESGIDKTQLQCTNQKNQQIPTLLRIRNVYPVSDFIFRIRTVSIPDPGTSKQKYLNAQNSRKINKLYKISCVFFVPDTESGCYLSPIPDPGSRGQKATQSRISAPGSGSATLDCNELSDL